LIKKLLIFNKKNKKINIHLELKKIKKINLIKMNKLYKINFPFFQGFCFQEENKSDRWNSKQIPNIQQ
jgi:hypothetical protein